MYRSLLGIYYILDSEAPAGRASILSSPLTARPNAPVQEEILGAVSPATRMSAASSAPSPVAPSTFTPPTVENSGPVPTDPTTLDQTNNVLEAFINWTSELQANIETLVANSNVFFDAIRQRLEDIEHLHDRVARHIIDISSRQDA
ncbi:hypothetical protein ABEF95_007959 [Exophiala dermatitidis]